MFIPFLPLLIVYAALLAIGAGEPARAAGHVAALAYLGLLALGPAAAWLGEAWHGWRHGRSDNDAAFNSTAVNSTARSSMAGSSTACSSMAGNSMALGPRRVLHGALWLGLAAWSPAQATLTAALHGLAGGGELAALGMLVNYWISDALAQAPALRPRWLTEPAARQQWLTRVGHTLRMGLPVMGLLAVAGAGMVVLAQVATGPLEMARWPWWLHGLGSLLLYGTMMAAVIPPLIRFGWRLRPLADSEVTQRVRAELAANGIRGMTVLAWPEHLTNYTTAGVIGMLPGLRYLLVGDTLARACTPDELGAIVAHEAGHVRRRHLLYYLLAIGAMLIALQAVLMQVWLGTTLLGFNPDPLLLVGAELVIVLLFLRYGLGALSRAFERQADAHALARWHVGAFRGALAKVAALNGIALEQRNWHHFGIAQRIGFLEAAQSEPQLLVRHHRKVARLKGLLIVGMVAALGLQAMFSGSSVVGFVAEQVWADRLTEGRLDTATAGTPQAVLAMQVLSARALSRGDTAAAAGYFRQWLAWRPDDPRALNNLGWILVTKPRAAPTERREGLTLAQRAVALEDAAYAWDTLAEAYAGNGRYQDAQQAARRALRLARQDAGTGDASVAFYEQRLQEFQARAAANPEPHRQPGTRTDAAAQ